MRESAIEKYLVSQVEKIGGQCYKFTSPGRRGVPDRVILLPGGVILFVELKAKTGRTSPIQDREITRMRALGARVWILTGKEEVERFVEGLGHAI